VIALIKLGRVRKEIDTSISSLFINFQYLKIAIGKKKIFSKKLSFVLDEIKMTFIFFGISNSIEL
jgi:hypothetical protein